MASDPVVLLHGQPGSAADWDLVRAAVADRVEVIVHDRPGWDGQRPAGGIADNARSVVELLDEHGIGRATIAGHSFGAAIACRVAEEFPDRVNALILLAPAANVASLLALDRLLALPRTGPLLTAGMLGGAGWALAAPPVRHRMADLLHLPETYLRTAAAHLRSPRAWDSFGIEQRALLRELPALEARLGSIVAPTRILIGDDDRIVPPESAVKLNAQIRGAELERIRRTGHLLPVLAPERIADAIVGASAG